MRGKGFIFEAGNLQGFEVALAAGQIATQALTLQVHVLELGRVLFRLVVGHVFELFIGNRNTETITEGLERFVLHALDLVRFVGRFAIAAAHTVTFNGVRQDDRGLAVRGIHRLVIGRIHLERVVATAVEFPDIFVREVFDHRLGFWVLTKEVLAGIRATVGLVVLVLAVDRFVHALLKDAFLILLEQRIPVTAPNDLDHVPASPAEDAFELVHDAGVAAYRAVQALQVTVDNEDQVVEIFTTGQ